MLIYQGFDVAWSGIVDAIRLGLGNIVVAKLGSVDLLDDLSIFCCIFYGLIYNFRNSFQRLAYILIVVFRRNQLLFQAEYENNTSISFERI